MDDARIEGEIEAIVAGRPALREALRVCPIQSPRMRLEFLLTPDSVFDDLTPVEAADAGRGEEVIDYARG